MLSHKITIIFHHADLLQQLLEPSTLLSCGRRPVHMGQYTSCLIVSRVAGTRWPHGLAYN